MKNQLLAGLFVLALISCEGEDTTQPVENNSLPATELDSITFLSGGTRDVMRFEDNKLQFHGVAAVPDGLYQLNYSYTYNQDGQVSALTGIDSYGEVFLERTVTYDSQGRIIAKNDINYNWLQGTSDQENVTFTYDDVQNTVFADYDSTDDTVNDRTYHFNAEGLVFKVTRGEEIIQDVQYNGNNIAVLNDMSFSYDTDTPVKGEYLNIYRNQFNSYANFVLYNGYMVARTVAENYITKLDQDSGPGQDVDYVYKFNEDGYPIKVNELSITSNDVEIFITYK